MTGDDKCTAPTRRLTSLDAVRGIASFIVMLSHCYLTIPEEPRSTFDAHLLWSRPLRILYNGNGAVIIFFVLSGYVLALPFFRGTQPNYPRYLLKRVCRIYIPFAVSIIIAACLYHVTTRQLVAHASDWFNTLWPSSWPGVAVLAGHFLMTGTEPDMKLDIVMWSLVYEMRISLIFPLLMILCRDTRRALFGGLLLVVVSTKILAALGELNHPSHAPTFWITLLWTIKFAPSFLTGILLSKHAPLITRVVQRMSARMRVFLVAVPVLIIFSVNDDFEVKKDALYDVGAALAIVLALEIPGIRAFLDGAIPQWLGRISYSVYLIHLPIFLIAFPLLLGRMPFVLVALAALAAALGAATAMQILVEAPAIRFGHRLARAARPTTVNDGVIDSGANH